MLKNFCERCGDEWVECMNEKEEEKTYICNDCAFETGICGDDFNINN